MERAEARLKDNPWDIEAWQILIKEYSSKKLEDARPFYERLVTQFPLSGRYWKLYIDHEMKARNYSKVEQLFQRCLMKVLHIELWKCYLNYVKVSYNHIFSTGNIQTSFSPSSEPYFLEFILPHLSTCLYFTIKSQIFLQFLQRFVIDTDPPTRKQTHTQIILLDCPWAN